MSTATTTETTARCDASKIEVGSTFSRHSHGQVVQRRGDLFTLRNQHGFEWDINGANILEAEFSFADQHDNEVKESRSKINEILQEHAHTAMTIVFNKKPDPKHVAKELSAGKGSETDRNWNAKVKKLIEGEERTMIGYHTSSFDEHQRLKFIEQGKGPRLVDTRTIKMIVVGRTKYTVKK